MILVAGSANLDFVVRASHIPAPGETVLGRDFQTFPGGKGANQAIACARAGGAATHMLLALGDDAFARPIEASLNQAGVASHVARTPDQPTGTAFICVSDDAENAITVAPGANSALQAEHLPPLTGFSHLLLQLETPLGTVAADAQAAQAQGVQVVLNAAPAQVLPAALLANVNVLVVIGGGGIGLHAEGVAGRRGKDHIDIEPVAPQGLLGRRRADLDGRQALARVAGLEPAAAVDEGACQKDRAVADVAIEVELAIHHRVAGAVAPSQARTSSVDLRSEDR